MSEAWNLQALRAQVKIRLPDTSERLVQVINSLADHMISSNTISASPAMRSPHSTPKTTRTD